MRGFISIFILTLIMVSCEKQIPKINITCATSEPVEILEKSNIRMTTYDFEQVVEKSTPDFTLSFYVDKSLNFKESVVLVKASVDELKRLGWKTYVPDATIFKLDTLPVFKDSKQALMFMSKIRNGANPKGTFTVYLTKQNIGGIAYVLGRSKNYIPNSDVAVVGVTGNRELDVFVIVHELGHIFGSRHTHDCVWNRNNTAIDACGGTTCNHINEPGSIMSYCGQAWRNPWYHLQTLDTMKSNIKDINPKYK